MTSRLIFEMIGLASPSALNQETIKEPAETSGFINYLSIGQLDKTKRKKRQI